MREAALARDSASNRVAELEAALKLQQSELEIWCTRAEKAEAAQLELEAELKGSKEECERAQSSLSVSLSLAREEKIRADKAEATLEDLRQEVLASEARVSDLRREVSDFQRKNWNIDTRSAEVAQKALEDFRTSPEYRLEVGEAALDAFLKGFEDFRRQAARAIPEHDFSSFEPAFDGDDEEPIELVEQGMAEVTPDEAPSGGRTDTGVETSASKDLSDGAGVNEG